MIGGQLSLPQGEKARGQSRGCGEQASPWRSQAELGVLCRSKYGYCIGKDGTETRREGLEVLLDRKGRNGDWEKRERFCWIEKEVTETGRNGRGSAGMERVEWGGQHPRLRNKGGRQRRQRKGRDQRHTSSLLTEDNQS